MNLISYIFPDPGATELSETMQQGTPTGAGGTYRGHTEGFG